MEEGHLTSGGVAWSVSWRLTPEEMAVTGGGAGGGRTSDQWCGGLVSVLARGQWSGEKKFRSGPGRDQRLISGTVPGPGPGLFYCFIVHLTNAV